MNNNEQNFQITNQEKNNEKNEFEESQLNNINSNAVPENISNSNQSNLQKNNEKELDEQDGTDNLRFKDNNYNNFNFYIQHRLDSYDSTAAQYKFSIDLPNAPKQRLHEYLNDDLLNALEVSPNIPNLNSGITNNQQLSISNENPSENNQNNPNNLYGFSLYPQSNDNNNSNNNNNNTNNCNNQEIIKINNNINNGNININNHFNNVYNFNNYQNYNYANNNFTNLKYNINNPQVYIPTKFRNKEQIYNKEIISGQKSFQNQKKEEQNNTKNKFDNNKKNGQNFKKEGKNKKHFEIRAGDWTCSKCNNLNFSFRNKCNRCGLPKELNNKKIEQINPEIFGQNMNYQLINSINSNFFYGNNNVNNINNVNNSNDVKFYPK